MRHPIIVVVGIIKKQNKDLLTKRHDPKRPFVHNTWEFPGGGLNFGELVEKCLRREIREELDVDIEIINLILDIYEKYIPKENWLGIVLGFLCKLNNADEKIKLNYEAREYS